MFILFEAELSFHIGELKTFSYQDQTQNKWPHNTFTVANSSNKFRFYTDLCPQSTSQALERSTNFHKDCFIQLKAISYEMKGTCCLTAHRCNRQQFKAGLSSCNLRQNWFKSNAIYTSNAPDLHFTSHVRDIKGVLLSQISEFTSWVPFWGTSAGWWKSLWKEYLFDSWSQTAGDDQSFTLCFCLVLLVCQFRGSTNLAVFFPFPVLSFLLVYNPFTLGIEQRFLPNIFQQPPCHGKQLQKWF